MPLLNIDVADADEDVWAVGLARIVVARADAAVTVEGLDAPVTGALVHVGRDGFVVIDQREDDSDVGTVVLVPADRIISVRAAYRRRDSEAERRAAVAADEPFLDRVRELAEPLTDRIRQVGSTRVAGAAAHDLEPLLREGPYAHYDRAHIEAALELLEERGLLPPRRVV